jgi:hypothetical protein
VAGSIHAQPRQADRQPGQHHARRDAGVGGHVEERPPDVEVVHSPAQKEQCGDGIHDDPRRGHPHHDGARDRLGPPEAQQGLPRDPADGHHQEHGVQEGGEDGGTAEAVRPPRSGRPSGQVGGAPRQKETEHVAEVVTGVREEGQGIRPEAEPGFQDDEPRVQADTQREGTGVVGRLVRVAVGHAILPDGAWRE